MKNKVAKKTVYEELIKKANANHTSDSNNLVERVDCNTEIA